MERHDGVTYRQSGGALPGPTLVAESDESLAARAATDEMAFAEIYRRYVIRIYSYCNRRLQGRDVVEDATSQVFLKALEALHRSHVAHVRSWLFAIAHNEVTDRYRQQRHDVQIDLMAAMPSDGVSPEESAIASAGAHELRALLVHLPPDQRQVVELRLTGLTGPEIREVLGKSRSWVDTTQHRAIRRLRELMTKQSMPEDR